MGAGACCMGGGRMAAKVLLATTGVDCCWEEGLRHTDDGEDRLEACRRGVLPHSILALPPSTEGLIGRMGVVTRLPWLPLGTIRRVRAAWVAIL